MSKEHNLPPTQGIRMVHTTYLHGGYNQTVTKQDLLLESLTSSSAETDLDQNLRIRCINYAAFKLKEIVNKFPSGNEITPRLKIMLRCKTKKRKWLFPIS